MPEFQPFSAVVATGSAPYCSHRRIHGLGEGQPARQPAFASDHLHAGRMPGFRPVGGERRTSRYSWRPSSRRPDESNVNPLRSCPTVEVF
jgi:hypothetical protein